VRDQSRILAGAAVGALVGAAAAYLFFTEEGRQVRDRIEPAIDDLRGEFARFQKTIGTIGDMANEGLRVIDEFNAARGQSQYSTGSSTSH
jgi:gas vesicle protein